MQHKILLQIRLLPVALLALFLIGCQDDAQPSVAFPTWQDQLKLANSEAHKLDPNAVLMEVLADSIKDAAQPIHSKLTYLKPSGVFIWMEITDESPPSLVKIDPTWSTSDSIPEQSDLDRYAKAATLIQIGPRDVYNIVRNDIPSPFLDTTVVSVAMFLDDDQMPKFGIPSVWEGSMRNRTKDNKTSLLIAPQSGAILERFFTDSNGITKPIP